MYNILYTCIYYNILLYYYILKNWNWKWNISIYYLQNLNQKYVKVLTPSLKILKKIHKILHLLLFTVFVPVTVIHIYD